MSKIIEKLPQELLDASNIFSMKLEWARRIPVYEIHKWWARRYSGIVRLFLIYSQLEQKVLKKVDNFEKFVENLYYYPPKMKGTLLDPFCGGGTIIIEGSKLGFKSFGIEINKLPCLFLSSINQLNSNEHIELNVIEKKIITLSKKLKHLWTTRCERNHTAFIIHSFLARKNSHFLLKFNEVVKNKNYIIYFCEKCRKLIKASKKIEECPYCRNNFKTKWKNEKSTNNFEPYVIEYFCPQCNKRGFKVASVTDIKKFNVKIKKKCFPIPNLNETRRLLNMGFKDFADLLTPRQYLTFKMFLEMFKKQPYRNLAKLLVSDALRSCSLLAYYSWKYRKVIPGFVIKSYWIPFQPVELNPLSFIISNGKLYPLGRGNIISSLRKLRRAIDFLKENKIESNFKVFCGPAQEILKKINETFNLIFTDPPYANLQYYSDLSLFNLAIIRELDRNYLEKMIREEIVMRNKRDIKRYKEGLFKVFSLAKQKLSKNGKIILTFHHSDISMFYNLLEVFKKLSLSLEAIYPVVGESSGKLSKRKIYLDLLFVFSKKRKRNPYYTFTSVSFTKYDKLIQEIIPKLIDFYCE